MPIGTIQWRDARLYILDQTLLPLERRVIPLDTADDVFEAIQSLRVRGAPAIGVTAAYGVVVGLRAAQPKDTADALVVVDNTAIYLGASRPTAVNLFWALARMQRVAHRLDATTPLPILMETLEAEAKTIHAEDLELCRAIGEHGAGLIPEGAGVLTHCNAGGLATSGYGTALAMMFWAHEQGRKFQVYADETRPLLQGARLTAWELQAVGIPVTVICDNMAAHLMRQGRVQLVVVGADRITANGDVANKIGTYGLAVLAQAHDIPFYVAAPYSTFDPALCSGDDIIIEERAATEITEGFGIRTVPEGVSVYNPAFDVTPAELVSGIITERGLLRAPYGPAIAALLAATATETQA